MLSTWQLHRINSRYVVSTRYCISPYQNAIQKSRCSNHRAQNNGSMQRAHLDCTGKGACGCARHGAFIPHCVVDFQKGERFVSVNVINLITDVKLDRRSRQINIDYAICEALKRFPGRRAALIIYDICCQWFTNFRKRISESEWLDMWDDIEITAAVGKWHLAAHVRECFAKFSLNFIEGSAEVDGEIMETLWSGLDLVAGITQGMTIAHRQEVLDDYINDNNWKKLLNLCTSFLMMLTISIHTLNSNHTRS